MGPESIVSHSSLTENMSVGKRCIVSGLAGVKSVSVDHLILTFNPYPAELIYLNFQPLEIVSRCRDPQPQVVENYSYLCNLTPNIY